MFSSAFVSALPARQRRTKRLMFAFAALVRNLTRSSRSSVDTSDDLTRFADGAGEGDLETTRARAEDDAAGAFFARFARGAPPDLIDALRFGAGTRATGLRFGDEAAAADSSGGGVALR